MDVESCKIHQTRFYPRVHHPACGYKWTYFGGNIYPIRLKHWTSNHLKIKNTIAIYKTKNVDSWLTNTYNEQKIPCIVILILLNRQNINKSKLQIKKLENINFPKVFQNYLFGLYWQTNYDIRSLESEAHFMSKNKKRVLKKKSKFRYCLF